MEERTRTNSNFYFESLRLDFIPKQKDQCFSCSCGECLQCIASYPIEQENTELNDVEKLSSEMVKTS